LIIAATFSKSLRALHLLHDMLKPGQIPDQEIDRNLTRHRIIRAADPADKHHVVFPGAFAISLYAVHILFKQRVLTHKLFHVMQVLKRIDAVRVAVRADHLYSVAIFKDSQHIH